MFLGKPWKLACIELIIDKTKNIGALVDGFVRPNPPDARFKEAMESACGGSLSVYNRFVRNVVVICCRLVVIRKKVRARPKRAPAFKY